MVKQLSQQPVSRSQSGSTSNGKLSLGGWGTGQLWLLCGHDKGLHTSTGNLGLGFLWTQIPRPTSTRSKRSLASERSSVNAQGDYSGSSGPQHKKNLWVIGSVMSLPERPAICVLSFAVEARLSSAEGNRFWAWLVWATGTGKEERVMELEERQGRGQKANWDVGESGTMSKKVLWKEMKQKVKQRKRNMTNSLLLSQE